MHRALVLARRGLGAVAPNPPVGAVAVRDGAILAEGWHRRFGAPHAEAEVHSAARDLRGSDLYVTLEPCAHHGKTPPCTDAIIAAGVRRVVYAAPDPNPATRGKGPARLREAGIVVDSGLGEAEARLLLAGYYRWIMAGIPLVTAKWAMTADGCVATAGGDSQWISAPETLRRTRRERANYDAILVGRGTAERDDPRLLAARRGRGGHQPLRILLDSSLAIGSGARLVRTAREAPLLVVGVDSKDATLAERRDGLLSSGAEVELLPSEDGRVAVDSLLLELGRRGITHLLLDGGPRVLGAWARAGSIDRIQVILAPKVVLGTGLQPIVAAGVARIAEATEILEPAFRRSGRDMIVEGALTRAGLGHWEEDLAGC